MPAAITKIPAKAHPLVQVIYAEMMRQGIGLKELSQMTGIPMSAIDHWKRRRLEVGPNVVLLEKCLNALGVELWPVRVEHRPAAKPTTRYDHSKSDPVRAFQIEREAA